MAVPRSIPQTPERYRGQSYGIDLLLYASKVIGQAIQERGLSFDKVGRLCDPPISGTAIGAFVRGNNWMKPERLFHVAQVLGLEAQELFPANPQATLPPNPAHPLVRIVLALRGRPIPLLRHLADWLEAPNPIKAPDLPSNAHSS